MASGCRVTRTLLLLSLHLYPVSPSVRANLSRSAECFSCFAGKVAGFLLLKYYARSVSIVMNMDGAGRVCLLSYADVCPRKHLGRFSVSSRPSHLLCHNTPTPPLRVSRRYVSYFSVWCVGGFHSFFFLGPAPILARVMSVSFENRDPNGLPKLLMAPCLFLNMMAGPTGVLLYVVLRAASDCISGRCCSKGSEKTS